jgi:hypothetical protein
MEASVRIRINTRYKLEANDLAPVPRNIPKIRQSRLGKAHSEKTIEDSSKAKKGNSWSQPRRDAHLRARGVKL